MLKKYRVLEIILILLILWLAWVFFSNKSVNVSGSFPDFPNAPVALNQIFFDNNVKPILITQSDQNGKFILETETVIDPGLYQLKLAGKWVYFVLSGEEKKIEIQGRLEDIDNYTFRLKGSEAGAEYVKLMRQIITNELPPQNLLKTLEEKSHPITAAYLITTLPSLKFLVTPNTINTIKNRMTGSLSESPYSKFLENFQPMLTTPKVIDKAKDTSGTIRLIR